MAFNRNPPLEKNIIGVSYRSTCIAIALVLLCANLILIISFPFRHVFIKCNSSLTGIDSFIFQYGDTKFAISGLILGVLNCAFDIVLLIGAITRKWRWILFWYIGAIPQFAYLLTFQSYCLATKECLECENTREFRRSYKFGFGFALALTIYFYTSFLFNVQLLYSYLKYQDEQMKTAHALTKQSVMKRKFSGYSMSALTGLN